MFLIGLTGGIAAGKSTVAKRWVEHGALEIDADAIAREVVEPGSDGLRQIVETFGENILNPDGSLNRAKLGELIFSDELKRLALNAIVHPLVKDRTKQILADLPSNAIAIYNVPLLVEAGVDHDFDFVVTVEAPEDEQVRRMVKHRGMTESEARARISAQAKPIERAAVADVILNSNQDINLLLRDADELWRSIEQKAEVKNG
ncbi:MAG: dephospho-CoA kinase [Micrococcales bacterium]